MRVEMEEGTDGDFENYVFVPETEEDERELAAMDEDEEDDDDREYIDFDNPNND